MWQSTLTLTILFILFTVRVNSQIITDRPDQTESAYTVPRGALQIEGGISLIHKEETTPDLRQLLLPTVLFRYGISSGVELRVMSQYELNDVGVRQRNGISDLELGTKIQLLSNEEINTQIAYLGSLFLPVGDKEVTSDTFGVSNRISISHSLSEILSLGYNLGYSYYGEERGDILYSLSLGIGISEKLGMFIETYGEVQNLDVFMANFDTGFTYLANPNLQFDTSFGTGINQKMYFFALGCSWLIRKK